MHNIQSVYSQSYWAKKHLFIGFLNCFLCNVFSIKWKALGSTKSVSLSPSHTHTQSIMWLLDKHPQWVAIKCVTPLIFRVVNFMNNSLWTSLHKRWNEYTPHSFVIMQMDFCWVLLTANCGSMLRFEMVEAVVGWSPKSSVPHNVTLFGSSINRRYNSLRWGHTWSRMIPSSDIKWGNLNTETWTQRECHVRWRQRYGPCSRSRKTPKAASPEPPGRHQARACLQVLSLKALRSNQACQKLDPKLPACRTVRQSMSVG